MDKYNIFRKGSATYYNSSLFFPSDKRSDITSLYAFVRVADDFVDMVPQDTFGFMTFSQDYYSSESKLPVVVDFKQIEKKYSFDTDWTAAFLRSMEMDLHKKRYDTIKELQTYLYGSSEVIGLFMNKILGISNVADEYARYLGKAMQLINFIRDIDEDISLGRIYIPQEDLRKFRISPNDFVSKKADKESMMKLIRFEIERYYEWQKKAEEGYSYLPKRYRIAVKTAGDMYKWTADKIYENPLIVFERKVKPAKWFIVCSGIKNAIFC